MIKHIVMWKLDESYSADVKNSIIKEFTEKLLNLDGKIGELKSISVNKNSASAPETNYELVLETTFNSIEDLKTYATHPEHIVCVNYLKQFKLQRSCVDYEY